MRMECAACGCVVDRGVRLVACANAACCCAQLPDEAMVALAQRVSNAWASADLDAIRDLLAANATWGAPEQAVPSCRNRSHVLKWYEAATGAGERATIYESTAYANAIVIGLNVSGISHAEGDESQVRWQALSVRDGLISEIRGYESRDEAQEFVTSMTSQWSD